MDITVQFLADLLSGEVVGDPQAVVRGPARIESARPGDVCFYANPKYEKYVYTTTATALIVNKDFVPSSEVTPSLVKVEDAYAAVPVMLDFFASQRRRKLGGNRFLARLGVGTSIAFSARIGRKSHIFPQVYIGPDVRIGRGCVIYPGVKIYAGCVIGDRCIIHSNAVIGADGFGFARLGDGSYRKIPQSGNVVVGDDVEIGAGTCIDRATMGSTLIGNGVKIDDQCMVAHNVSIGENTVIAAQSGIAGSTRIGKNCVIAGKVGVAGHLEIADNTTICAGSGIQGSIRKPGGIYMGAPAFEYHKFMRAYAIFKNSPDNR